MYVSNDMSIKDVDSVEVKVLVVGGRVSVALEKVVAAIDGEVIYTHHAFTVPQRVWDDIQEKVTKGLIDNGDKTSV